MVTGTGDCCGDNTSRPCSLGISEALFNKQFKSRSPFYVLVSLLRCASGFGACQADTTLSSSETITYSSCFVP